MVVYHYRARESIRKVLIFNNFKDLQKELSEKDKEERFRLVLVQTSPEGPDTRRRYLKSQII